MADQKHASALANRERANPNASAPARADRPKALKLQLSIRHRRALEQLGLNDRTLAEQLGTRRQVVQRWGSADEEGLPRVDHLAAGPTEWMLAVLRPVLEMHRHHAQPAPAVVHGDNHAARLAALVRETSDPARSLSAALTGTEMTVQQLEDVLQQARESTAATLELEAFAVAELARRRLSR